MLHALKGEEAKIQMFVCHLIVVIEFATVGTLTKCDRPVSTLYRLVTGLSHALLLQASYRLHALHCILPQACNRPMPLL